MNIVIRSLITVFLFSAFITLWYSAWRRENADRYAAAARLPLEDAEEIVEVSDPNKNSNAHSPTV